MHFRGNKVQLNERTYDWLTHIVGFLTGRRRPICLLPLNDGEEEEKGQSCCKDRQKEKEEKDCLFPLSLWTAAEGGADWTRILLLWNGKEKMLTSSASAPPPLQHASNSNGRIYFTKGKIPPSPLRKMQYTVKYRYVCTNVRVCEVYRNMVEEKSTCPNTNDGQAKCDRTIDRLIVANKQRG